MYGTSSRATASVLASFTDAEVVETVTNFLRHWELFEVQDIYSRIGLCCHNWSLVMSISLLFFPSELFC